MNLANRNDMVAASFDLSRSYMDIVQEIPEKEREVILMTVHMLDFLSTVVNVLDDDQFDEIMRFHLLAKQLIEERKRGNNEDI